MALEWEEENIDAITDDNLSVMNIMRMDEEDMLNGPGLRTVLWVSGCNHCCKECHNPETWDKNNGYLFDPIAEADFFDALSKDYISGCTFSGGDPLNESNRATIERLVKVIKSKYPTKTIWIYTGYIVQQITENAAILMHSRLQTTIEINWLKNVDVIVDGPFLCDVRKTDVEKSNDPHYRGSSNQRMIDIKKSIINGKITLWEETTYE